MDISDVLTAIDQGVDRFTFDAYHQLISASFPTFMLAFTVYFAWYGWLVMRGRTEQSPLAIAIHFLKVALAFTFITHWDTYARAIVAIALHGSEQLVAAVLSAKDYDATLATKVVTKIWHMGSQVFNDLWRHTSWHNFGGVLVALLGQVTVVAFVSSALFYLIAAKIILSVLLIIGPVFITFFLWQRGEALFFSWLFSLLKWLLVPVLIFSFVALFEDVLIQQLNKLLEFKLPTWVDISSFLILCLVSIATFRNTPRIADDLVRLAGSTTKVRSR